MEIDDEKIQELIAGYAVGALDEMETVQVEQLLRTSEPARHLLAEFEEVTVGLALSVDPVELPAGSLDRLRVKAGVAAVQTAQPIPFRAAPARKAFWTTSTIGAMAAALVLFVTTAVFGVLWYNANNQLDQSTKNQQALAQILSSSDLKTASFKATGTTADGNVRVYADPTTNKVYLVAQNMTALSGDKEYEAWLIAGDNKPQAAGLLGTGVSTSSGMYFELSNTLPVDQYKSVALTIEKKGGASIPSQPPVLVANMSA